MDAVAAAHHLRGHMPADPERRRALRLATSATLAQNRHARLALAESNIVFFAKYYFSDFFNNDTPDFHWSLIDIARELERTRDERGTLGSVVAAPRGHAKCLSAATSIQCADGQRRRLADIQPGQTIMSLNEQSLQFEPDRIVAKVRSGIKPVITITTRTGKQITLTQEHRVLTFDGWKLAGDLTVSDRIASPRHIPIAPTIHDCRDEEIKLIAYFIAEGSLSSGNCSFTNNDPDVIQDFYACAEAMGFVVAPGTGSYAHRVRAGTRAPRDWLRSLGLYGHTAYTKRIPSFVFGLPDRQKWLFIEAFMVTDGWFARQGGQGGITLANEALIDDLITLFAQVGIICSKRYRPNTCAGAWSLYFGGIGVRRMLNHIDLKHKRAPATEIAGKHCYSLIDTYPASVKRLASHGSEWYRTRRERIDTTYDITREKLQRLMALDPVPVWQHLEQAAVFWDQITSIQDAGECETYDVQVARHANLITNNLITHNSTLLTFLIPLYWICFKKKRFIIIVSDTATMADGFVGDIRKQLETNVRLIADFGDLCGDTVIGRPLKWTQSDFTSAHKDAKGRPTFTTRLLARGTGAQFRGLRNGPYRPDAVLCDDLENDELVRTPEQRSKTWNWFMKAVIPAIDPKNGGILVIGTILHFDGLLNRLLKQAQDHGLFAWRIYKAIKKNGMPLWPARFTKKTLDDLKRALGTLAFNSEYLNIPIDEEARLYRPEWIKWFYGHELEYSTDKGHWTWRGEILDVYAGVDPAISEDESADYFAIVVIGVARESKAMVILYTFAGRMDFPTQVQEIIRLDATWRPTMIGIEKNAYQRALPQQLMKQSAKLRIKQLQNTTKKYTRIMSASVPFENGQVWMRAAGDGEQGDPDETGAVRVHDFMTPLYHQQMQYPTSAHDDVLDAMENCMQVARQRRRGMEGWTNDDDQ